MRDFLLMLVGSILALLVLWWVFKPCSALVEGDQVGDELAVVSHSSVTNLQADAQTLLARQNELLEEILPRLRAAEAELEEWRLGVRSMDCMPHWHPNGYELGGSE